MKSKLLKIMNHFGIKNQLKKINEECYELIEAINDYIECDKSDEFEEQHYKEHIIEELADNFVLLTQIMEYYKIDDIELSNLIDSKIDRTIDRISSGYYK